MVGCAQGEAAAQTAETRGDQARGDCHTSRLCVKTRAPLFEGDHVPLQRRDRVARGPRSGLRRGAGRRRQEARPSLLRGDTHTHALKPRGHAARPSGARNPRPSAPRTPAAASASPLASAAPAAPRPPPRPASRQTPPLASPPPPPGSAAPPSAGSPAGAAGRGGAGRKAARRGQAGRAPEGLRHAVSQRRFPGGGTGGVCAPAPRG